MTYSITGILIASGYSGRMGKLKALLPYAGISFINGIIIKLSLVCNKVIVVLGHEYEQLQNEINILNGLSSAALSPKLCDYIINAFKHTEIVFNETYNDGMFTSLKRGLSTADNSDWYLYHFVDQPHLPCRFYNLFADQIDLYHDWIQPRFGDRNGHPLLFNETIAKLITKSDKLSLKDVAVKFQQKKFWSTDYYQILDDIDTEEDFNKLSSLKTQTLFCEIENFI